MLFKFELLLKAQTLDHGRLRPAQGRRARTDRCLRPCHHVLGRRRCRLHRQLPAFFRTLDQSAGITQRLAVLAGNLSPGGCPARTGGHAQRRTGGSPALGHRPPDGRVRRSQPRCSATGATRTCLPGCCARPEGGHGLSRHGVAARLGAKSPGLRPTLDERRRCSLKAAFPNWPT